ncbi:CDP-glycerol glycerophosphotransferase family protein [candidate division KSB1 bacterium]|nr:CDP-glycerol glycerophosphotransferase family protein [candidate division KSB1 bacterium]
MPVQKKTIFAVGLFPDKNKNFLRNLCKRFRVIMLRGQCFDPGGKYSPEAVEDLLPEEDQQLKSQEFNWELYRCMKFTEQQLKILLGGSDQSQLTKEEYERLFRTTSTASLMAHVFKKLTERIKIDMVVSNADYSVFRRPIVLEAKKMGIPTLNIEHGFFATTIEPSALIDKNRMPSLIFFSDFVNLDNQIEKEIWEKYYKLSSAGRHIQFLTLGTPNDESYDRDIAKIDAIKFLGLKQKKFTIMVASTWIEARNAAAPITGQIEHVEYFNRTLECLRNLQQEQAIQVILKLHPAYSTKQVFKDAKLYLQRYAESIGLKVGLITCKHISKVIAASDLIISPHMSSILWEGVMAGIPGLLFPIPSFYFKTYRKDKLNESNILCRRGILRFVFNGQELMKEISYYLDSKNYTKFKRDVVKLCADKQISFEPVEEKSRRICDWIEKFLSTDTPPKVIRVSEFEDERVNMFFQMGKDLIRDGKFKEGLDLLSQVLQLDPRHSGALKLLGELFQKSGQEAKAKKMWQLAENQA